MQNFKKQTNQNLEPSVGLNIVIYMTGTLIKRLVYASLVDSDGVKNQLVAKWNSWFVLLEHALHWTLGESSDAADVLHTWKEKCRHLEPFSSKTYQFF